MNVGSWLIVVQLAVAIGSLASLGILIYFRIRLWNHRGTIVVILIESFASVLTIGLLVVSIAFIRHIVSYSQDTHEFIRFTYYTTIAMAFWLFVIRSVIWRYWSDKE